jgi:ATP phosphoribosyltransferase regulatory subunit
LGAEAEQKLLALCTQSGTPDQVLSALAPMLRSQKERQEFKALTALCQILAESGYQKNLRLDFSVGNDMKYYSGVVFKGYIQGIPEGVLSGGQYDKLLQKMGRKSGAIGFAVYLDLLERLADQRPEYDFDILLIPDVNVDAKALCAAVKELQKEGSVRVAYEIPEDISCRKVIKLTEGGLQNGSIR